MKMSSRAADVGMVVGGGGPQTQDVRAVLIEDVGGIHAVAQRLVHGLALAVHGPAVGDALLEGRALAEGAHGGQQGGLEPAAVLVQALQIHGRQARSPGPASWTAKWVEPESNQPSRVSLSLVKPVCAAAVGAGEALGQELRSLLCKPGVGALLARTGRRRRRWSRRCRWACRSPCSRPRGWAGPTCAGGRCTSRRAPGSWTSSGRCPSRAPSATSSQAAHGLVLEGVHGAEPLGRWPGR